MPEPLPAVLYIFAHARHAPHSKADLIRIPSVFRQQSAIREAERSGYIKVADRTLDVTTNRQSPFYRRRPFKLALQLAANAGAVIAIADMVELLTTLHVREIRQASQAFCSCSVEIWDASRRKAWQAMSADERDLILLLATHLKGDRSKSVRQGLSARAGYPPSTSNATTGTTANVARANRLARQLEPIVDEVLATLPKGSTPSASYLAHALNARKIPAPRGDTWKHNSAKLLLERTQRLKDKT